jgi:tetratricopeptide (TPR) repeat protein
MRHRGEISMRSPTLIHKMVCPILLILAAPGAALAQAADTPSDAGLGDEFFKEHDYFRAITEYRRDIYRSQDPERQHDLWMRIGDAYLRAERRTEAMELFTRLSQAAPDERGRAWADYRLAVTLVEAGAYSEASKKLRTFSLGPGLSVVGADRVALFQAVILFEQADWLRCSRAVDDFRAAYPQSELLDVARSLRVRAERGPQLPRRSPVLAAIMSALVPGLGQIYTGRYSDGIQSLAIVGTLGFTSGVLFYSEHRQSNPSYALPIIVTGLASVFYASNVYGAANGARMETVMQKYQHIGESREIYREAVRGDWRDVQAANPGKVPSPSHDSPPPAEPTAPPLK